MSETPARRPLVAGNWKMHGSKRSLPVLEAIIRGAVEISRAVDVMICPPATLIACFAAAARDSGTVIGAQDCHGEPAGAYTGDISAEMLADAGARAVIVGHSERRRYHHETDADVQAKVKAAWRAGLLAIACIGETEAERRGGQTLAVVERQLTGSLPERASGENLVIAYEPVWAIGTGLTPTENDISEVHDLVHAHLTRRFGGASAKIRVLYGGSVNRENARKLLLVRVDGALVGGASLKADDFLGILAAYGDRGAAVGRDEVPGMDTPRGIV